MIHPDQEFAASSRDSDEVVKANHLAALAGLLEQGGATTDDMEILDFADDAKAANAFATGERTFTAGALPQEARLVYSSEFEGKFIIAAPQQAFGPGEEGVLLYSLFFTRDDWLEENREVAQRLLAVWLRTTRYLREQPEVVLPIIADAVKASTGGLLDDETTEAIMTDLFSRRSKRWTRFLRPGRADVLCEFHSISLGSRGSGRTGAGGGRLHELRGGGRDLQRSCCG